MDHLFVHTAQILARVEGRDAENAPTEEFAPRPGLSDVPCRIRQLSGREIADRSKAGRQADAMGYFSAAVGARIEETDQVVVDGSTYRIVAPLWANYSTALHHFEIELQRRVG
jgi:hypothetical protein